MTEILIDLNIYDAMYDNNTIQRIGLKVDSTYLYSHLFEKHQVSKSQFDSSLKYYSQYPELLLEITENVYSSIEYTAEKEKQIATDIDRAINRYWHESDDIFLEGDIGDSNIYIHIPFDSLGEHYIKTTIRYHGNDESNNPAILAFFTKSTGNYADSMPFNKIPIFPSEFTRDYVNTGTINDTNYKYIVVKFFDMENADTGFFRNIQITNIEAGLIPEK